MNLPHFLSIFKGFCQKRSYDSQHKKEISALQKAHLKDVRV